MPGIHRITNAPLPFQNSRIRFNFSLLKLKDMAIHVMENFVSVEEYARLCGVPRRTVMDRIKARNLSAVKIDGYHAVNTVANPPLKDMRGKPKSLSGGAHTPGGDLRAVVSWCSGKGIRSYPYLRAIILGKIDAWVYGQEVFARKDDLERFKRESA